VIAVIAGALPAAVLLVGVIVRLVQGKEILP
jgi:hypothetical protein